MTRSNTPRPRVFVDADVLFAGAASTNKHSASLLVLRLAEITLLEAVTSQQVITEVERNLETKLPAALPLFKLLVSRCLSVVENPSPREVRKAQGRAQVKDLPILVAALEAECRWLVTFNLKDFTPGFPEVVVLTPGDFILHLRSLLADWISKGKD